MPTWAEEGQPSVILETPATPSRAHRLLELIRYFLWLGVLVSAALLHCTA
jgi:hypothetical protein